MSSTITIVLIFLAVFIFSFYFFSMTMRRRTEGQIIALEERKEALFDLPIQDEFDAVKNMHLVGQSQKLYRDWHQKWIDLSQNDFAELENQIFEAEQLNDSFRWSKAKKTANEAESQIAMMEEDANRIREGLDNLMEQERHNSNKIQGALDMYDQLRKHIADTAERYGSAIGMVESSLSNIETEFNQFVELNAKGDPIEAAEILGIAEDHTAALANITDRIPEIIHLVDEEYENELQELEEAHVDFEKKNYIFPSTFNLEQSLKNVREKLKQTKVHLEKFELDSAETLVTETKQQIDMLYDIFEKEYNGRRSFEKNSSILKGYLEHTRENNRNLLLEIDHALQSYILPDNEKASVRSYQVQIDDLDKEVDAILVIKDNIIKEQPFSMLNRRVNAVMERLQEIEADQMQINNKISSLSIEEKRSKEKAIEMDTRLRMIRRFVEKNNLPGLPTTYLENFFMVNSHVEKLFKELDRIRINMDNIKHMTEVASAQLEELKNATDSLVDNVVLTEQLMQYANRFKASEPSVAEAIQRALALFERDNNYTEAFNIISQAVEKVEAGVTTRIVHIYNDQKVLPEYRL